MALNLALAILIPASLGLAVLAGSLGVILPAMGVDPVTGQNQLSIAAFAQLSAMPGFWRAAFLSYVSGLAATIIAVLVVFGFLATAQSSRRIAERVIGPLLAVPHAAAAIGIAFLLAPSGFIMRLLSPWATGYDRPPDWLIPGDPLGLSLIAGLVVKEVPFIFLVTIAALPLVQEPARMKLAASLGYARVAGWLKTVAPDAYARVRLPILAVIAYATSNVEVALVLGPSHPPTLAILTFRLMYDPDLTMRTVAAAAACAQIGVTILAIITWLGLEKLCRYTIDRSITSGRRDRPSQIFGRLAEINLFSVVLATGLLLIGLIITSFSWRWRFPDAWPASFSLQHWQRASPNLMEPMANSVLLASVAALLGLIIIMALLESHAKLKIPGTWQMATTFMLFLPLLVPQIGFMAGLVTMVEWIGLGPSFWVVLFGHLIMVVPYLYLTTKDPFDKTDSRYIKIAASLGHSPLSTLLRVRLPLLSTALFASAAIAFAVSIGQYLPTLLLGAGRTVTVTNEAVALVASGDRRTLGVWALIQTLLPALCFTLAIYWPRWQWRGRRGMQAMRP